MHAQVKRAPTSGQSSLAALFQPRSIVIVGASASSKVVNVATNLAAILAFAWAGHIWWTTALPMAACNIAGSQVGSRLALAKGAPFVRRLFLSVVLVLLGRMTWEALR